MEQPEHFERFAAGERPARLPLVTIRLIVRSRLLWFAVLGLAFIGASWVMSMQTTRGVSWRSGDRAVFLATSDGSVRLGYEGRAMREVGFGQWSIARGAYKNRTGDDGWFAKPGIHRDPTFESWIVAFPHWLLTGLWAGLLALVAAAGRRFRRATTSTAG